MRLLRKLLIESLRLRPWATDTALSKKEELAELLTEAQRLAEAVGNEDARWRAPRSGLPSPVRRRGRISRSAVGRRRDGLASTAEVLEPGKWGTLGRGVG